MDLAVNKSGEDFRNILGIPKVFDNEESRHEGRYEARYEARNESKYDYTTGYETGATGAMGRKQDIDTYHEMISKLPTGKVPIGKVPSDESRRRNAANAPTAGNAAYASAGYAGNDNDLTAEFQSPVRGKNAYTGPGGRDPPTVPRYSYNPPASSTAAAATSASEGTARNQSTRSSERQSSQSSRGRMDISDIPVVDSASDRSSPQAPSLTDDEKESLHEEKSSLGDFLPLIHAHIRFAMLIYAYSFLFMCLFFYSLCEL